MKVPIKFRGRALLDSCGQSVDKIVYGDLSQSDGKVTILDWDDGDIYEVAPESVAQLVGYDSKKREVYEGDRVVDKFGEEYIAQLTPTLRENHEGAGIFFRPTERFWVNISSYGTLTLVE
ncbi:MAG: hypothetical protein IJQ82_13290 [Selenomonadaceae bacterium]|nr:hypothetical protein [Selenomonadaceae bacterium]